MAVELARMYAAKDMEMARAVLEEVVEQAQSRGDERNEWLGRLELASLGQVLAPRDWMPRLKEVVEQGRVVFEELGDDLGLAKCWRLVAHSLGYVGRWDEAVACFDRSLAHARRAGDEHEQLTALTGRLFSMYFGATPVADVRRETEAYLQRVGGSPGWRIGGLRIQAGICGLEGAREDAQRYYLEARQLAEELGLKTSRAGLTLFAEEVGLLFGDAAFAESELRTGYALY